MKKSILFIFYLMLAGFLSAQVVTTEPTFITKGYTGTIKVIFDPTQGNKGMVNADYCYAHTGVTVTTSTGEKEQWLCAPTWRSEEEKYKLQKENDKWVLIIDNMYNYYNCAEAVGNTFEQLCFVFNDGSHSDSKEGKEADGGDIFVTIYDPELQVRFDLPETDQILPQGSSVDFSISSSETADITLIINGVTQKTISGTTLSHTYTFSSKDDYMCIAEAKKSNGEISRDTVFICVPQAVTDANRPSGLKEGINYYENDPSKVTLIMYAKDKSGNLPDNIFLLGDFNDWAYKNDYQLKKEGNSGYWWITLDNVTPGKEYAFQYAVNTNNKIIQISDAYTEKVLDPYDDRYLSEIYPGLTYPAKGDGMVSVFQTNKPAFQWSEATLNFSKSAPDKNNLVIYELWVYDFSAGRTIKAVTEKLDYLKSLGVNAIELMPITEFDGNISWGYNPNHFFAPDKAYGTPDEYKTFIDECHKRGIAVILDMVFNHSTGNHPFAKLYYGTNGVASNNPWYNTEAPHSDSVNQDYNHNFSGTRDYFKRVLEYWVKEYKVDGYRMDLTKGFCGEDCDGRTGDSRIDIINDYYASLKAVKEDVYFILEHWVGGEEQGFVNQGMLCWNNTNDAYSQTAMGWLQSGDSFTGANKKGWVSYCESHDEERNFYKAKTWGNGRTILENEEARLARVPLNVAFNVLLQGPKMLWQFEEMGYDFSITHDNSSRVDPKPVPEILGWLSDDLRVSTYKKVAQIIQLRTKLLSEVFSNGSISAGITSGSIVRFANWSYGEDKVHVIGNFGVEDYSTDGQRFLGLDKTATLPSGTTWYDYFTGEEISGGTVLPMTPGELRIFTNNASLIAPYIPDPTGIKNTEDNKTKSVVYPTMADDMIWILSDKQIESVQILGLRGEVVKTVKATDNINVSDLPKGMYLVIVSYGNSQEAHKIIKK
ncbi:MAG: T9SS type A sorting domain-containing protein [Candidatus Azobacteroides sp.]|nr:T9SS type A sorting domain-containing protein [Candidatus Azobacteroides sp.]